MATDLTHEFKRPATGGAAVDFEGVSIGLAGVPILEEINARVEPGSATAIIGPNGAGKTTLILALLGQVPYRGTIRVQCAPDGPDGVAGAGGRVRLGYVPQRLDFDRGLPMTVLDYLVMGHQRRPLWLGRARRERERALGLLEAVRAAHLAGRRLGALSGGELQRVQLALALSRDPQLLILDEPAAGVDIRGGLLLCELLETLQRERGFTQLMVTHDLPLVTAHASHVICLNHRVTGQGPTAATLTPAVLEATFGLHRGLPDPHGLAASGAAPHPPHEGCRARHD